MQNRKAFVGYEYKEITVPSDQVFMYLDCYENFGWVAEEKEYVPEKQIAVQSIHHDVTVCMKRDRKIMNKMELTRLQRNFEACAREIETLEKAKTQKPCIWSITVAIIGTVFMAGATFAVTHEPPIIWLCVLLAIPGFIGWIVPYFLYQNLVKKQTQRIDPLIEEKMEEIYKICEKGHSLL